MSIQGSELIALQKELNHIENYIYLQQMQYDEPFEVFYDIEDGTKKCKVLKFILQPIVENAIRHGFKDRSGKGTIEISSFIENNYLFLTVQDDGKGMTEEKVKELNDYINEKQEQVLTGYKKSIGMRNVNLRIKLCCGDLYGMAVKSKENMGTQVVFKLPVYGRLGGKKSV
jgi:two-component system sensor histidine kinase YesM